MAKLKPDLAEAAAVQRDLLDVMRNGELNASTPREVAVLRRSTARFCPARGLETARWAAVAYKQTDVGAARGGVGRGGSDGGDGPRLLVARSDDVIDTVWGMADVVVRAGIKGDAAAILDLWDGAIAWLVARGQPEQWGTESASARAQTREMVQQWVGGAGVRIAECGRRPVGVSVITPSRPEYVPPVERCETYLLFLVSSRGRAGQGIGSVLVRQAAADARAAGSQVLRVDCWAGAPGLTAWYARQGFVASDTYTVGDGWRGQVFEMDL